MNSVRLLLYQVFNIVFFPLHLGLIVLPYSSPGIVGTTNTVHHTLLDSVVLVCIHHAFHFVHGRFVPLHNWECRIDIVFKLLFLHLSLQTDHLQVWLCSETWHLRSILKLHIIIIFTAYLRHLVHFNHLFGTLMLNLLFKRLSTKGAKSFSAFWKWLIRHHTVKVALSIEFHGSRSTWILNKSNIIIEPIWYLLSIKWWLQHSLISLWKSICYIWTWH